MSLHTSTVHADSITEEDRRRAQEFIASDENSPLSVFLQSVLAATAREAGAEIVANAMNCGTSSPSRPLAQDERDELDSL